MLLGRIRRPLARAVLRSSKTSVEPAGRDVPLSRHVEKETPMAAGTVKWYNSQKGYGFIAPSDGGKDVFVHATALEAAGIRGLSDGQAVTFETREERGKLSAAQLKLA
jgi:CspA family cold shock protein